MLGRTAAAGRGRSAEPSFAMEWMQSSTLQRIGPPRRKGETARSLLVHAFSERKSKTSRGEGKDLSIFLGTYDMENTGVVGYHEKFARRDFRTIDLTIRYKRMGTT